MTDTTPYTREGLDELRTELRKWIDGPVPLQVFEDGYFKDATAAATAIHTASNLMAKSIEAIATAREAMDIADARQAIRQERKRGRADGLREAADLVEQNKPTHSSVAQHRRLEPNALRHGPDMEQQVYANALRNRAAELEKENESG